MAVIDTATLKKLTPLAEGGEGVIYEWNGLILKVYKPNVNLAEKQGKIKLLIPKQLPSNIIAPKEVAIDSNGKFIGFLMDRVEGEPIKNLSSKKFIQANRITGKEILYMLVQIKKSLQILHSEGIVIGDLNDKNILFDKNFQIYFIDVDSWVIGNYQNDVCMEIFKDPLLIGNNFTKETDAYAFSIINFKSLTRLHPFGGTTNPDMPILERMRRGISVIDNKKVTVPQNINRWESMHPDFLGDLQNIFQSSQRFIIDDSLEHFQRNIKPCGIHGDYYYSKFSDCPVCNTGAKVATGPRKIVGGDKTAAWVLLFDDPAALFFTDLYTYITQDGYIINWKSGRKIPFDKTFKYYFSEDGQVLFKVRDKEIFINDNQHAIFKINRSIVIILDKTIYYINLSNDLIALTVTDKGNYSKNFGKVAFNCVFEVADELHYFICNIYDDKKIINVDGYNCVMDNRNKLQEYGIHFDLVSKNWLFVYQDNKGVFNTSIFDKNKLIYENNQINYIPQLSNLCFYNGTIYIPGDKLIRGFNAAKNVFKDFALDIVEADSKLIKKDGKMIIVNEQEIYSI